MTQPSDSFTGENPDNHGLGKVNFWQTNEERKQKYWLLRSHGINSPQARRKRDWRLAKIERFLGIEPSNYHRRKQHDEALNRLCPIADPV